MTHHALASRRIGKGMAVIVLAATAVAGFGTAAHAHSDISRVSAEACTGGTVGRSVSVDYSTAAVFTTGVRLHVVSGMPDGPVIETRTVDLQGPVAVSVSFDLPPGTYYVDWEDRSGDGVTWSGRHSGLGDFYRGIYLSTLTVVEPCAAAVATTPAATTPTTVGTTVTTTPGQPPITPAGPTPSTTVPPAGSTVSSVPPAPPSTAATTTSRPPSQTLVATGANSTPMVMLGTVFVGLGAVSLLAARRSPRRS